MDNIIKLHGQKAGDVARYFVNNNIGFHYDANEDCLLVSGFSGKEIGLYCLDANVGINTQLGVYIDPICVMNEKCILNHQLIWRIVLWEYNRYAEEALTEELFIRYYGKCDGSHFYSKWKYCDYNFIKMIGYFGCSTKNGQKFCDMVMEQVIKYEQRKEQVWKQMN